MGPGTFGGAWMGRSLGTPAARGRHRTVTTTVRVFVRLFRDDDVLRIRRRV